MGIGAVSSRLQRAPATIDHHEPFYAFRARLLPRCTRGFAVSAAEPPQGANQAALGGSAAAKPQAWGSTIRAAEPPQGANQAPLGGSAAARPQAWGSTIRVAQLLLWAADALLI